MIDRSVMPRAALAATATAAVLAVGLVAPPGAGAASGTFIQGTGITINDATTATPYPSNIEVSGLPKGVTDVNVTLSSFDHTLPDHTDVMLVGPGGQYLLPMSDVGGGDDASGLNLTLDDQAATGLPLNTVLSSGTFKPTNDSTGADTFPGAPDPALAASTLAVFNGTDPNGIWRLFVSDDTATNTGDFSGGWSLQITTVDIPAAPVFTTPAANPSTDRDGDFILAGTAQAASTVKVFEGATQVGTATASGGSWAVALVDVADGSHVYTATATDAAGNTSALSATRTVRVDTIHPRVIRVRPTNGSDEVRRGANIRGWFSEDMRPGTMTRTNVRLVEVGTGDRVRVRVTYDPVTRKVTMNPREDLAADTRYKAVIGTGVRDVAGNALDQRARAGNQPKVWRFTTR